MTRGARRPIERLAARVGIVAEYLDQTGTERRVTSDDTRRAILGVLGIDASTDEAAGAALQALRREEDARLVDPIRVVVQGTQEAAALDIHVPRLMRRDAAYQVEVLTETGDRLRQEGVVSGERRTIVPLHDALPLGYHTARVTLSHNGREVDDEQTIIVVPPRAVSPWERVGGTGAFGVIANLYTIRSGANWGIGDLSDLETLATWSAEAGADFVGVNPLHALSNHGDGISPYSPVSRLFRNPIYIDVTRVPELALAPELRERIASPEIAARLAMLREDAHVRYEQVMATKWLVLDALHRVFSNRRDDVRTHAYDAYVAAHEPTLPRFATWMAISERHGADWSIWPAELRDVSSPEVAHFAETHRDRVNFHCWLQFEMDRQMAAAAKSAREAGMRVGIYQDLAIGTAPGGADTWAFPDLFVRGASVGAPPDPYSASGQNWGLPPIDPRALRHDRYRYFIALVRAGLRHAGALRVDHILGLFRLFWIPEGKTGKDGAYIRYPAHDLLGILALESVRHDALIVGEDLGTVPKEVPPALERWGILSSKVLYFERERSGAFKRAKKYPPLSLATANTHDMPTLAGFWSGRDIDVRRQVGLLESDEQAAEAEQQRERDKSALLERLAAEKVLPSRHEPRLHAQLRGAVHGFLGRTPSALIGLSLDDLAGETEPVNVPGVGRDRFPSWSRKMRLPLEVITVSDDVRAALRCDGRMRSRPEP